MQYWRTQTRLEKKRMAVTAPHPAVFQTTVVKIALLERRQRAYQ